MSHAQPLEQHLVIGIGAKFFEEKMPKAAHIMIAQKGGQKAGIAPITLIKPVGGKKIRQHLRGAPSISTFWAMD